MKILIVIPRFYPLETPRAYRWSTLAIRLAQLGHEVHVFTGTIPESPQEEIWNSIRILRAGTASIKDLLSGASTRLTKGDMPSLATQIKSKAIEIHQRFFQPFYFPDVYFPWLKTARTAFEQTLGEHTFDAVITVGLPMSAHLWGLRAKSSFSDMKWLVDMGDPYQIGSAQNTWIFQNKRRRLEQKVLRSCDAIAVTNRGLKQALSDGLEELKQKVHVISHFSDLPPANTKKTPTKGLGHLLYFGRFYQRLRPAKDFFDTLYRFNSAHLEDQRLELDIYGPTGSFLTSKSWKRLKKEAHYNGEVSRLELSKLILPTRSIALIIGNASSTQLPSKVFDMAALGLPILYYYYLEEDPGLKLLQDINYPGLMPLQHGDEISLHEIRRALNEKALASPPPLPSSHFITEEYLKLIQ